ncbi:MAG: M1 family metallopeptidase [Promethearchaeota archaeon]|nr:MAG: M1 family metallopeptidase [Candidatus Lokiarchaeota archaeon]
MGALIIIFESGQSSFDQSHDFLKIPNQFPKIATNGEEYSYYNLSIIFDDSTSSVQGNLTVNFFNNDPKNFSKIPFHIFLSGMAYEYRMGYIDILSVTKLEAPYTSLIYDEYSNNQTMWVHLDTKLEPSQNVSFMILFNSTIPDGGLDRANSHGSDPNRIYKFASFYPLPCVYDEFDGWNTDPYLSIGDPFYYDIAYYNLFIEAPSDYIIAATGKLIKKVNKGANIFYHFDPIYPVREVTFSASKGFIIESTLVNGVNVSTYYLPKSQFVWQITALNYGEQALTLFNETFGEYPYPTFNIVEEYTPFGGMEYPCQVYITEEVDDWGSYSDQQFYLENTIVHETGHQWWYNLVGNDEVDWGFLDEGLTCWSTDYYGEIIHGDWEYFQYPPYPLRPPYIDEVRTHHANKGNPSKINSSVYECIDRGMNYYYIAYRKTPLILEKLRNTIGNSNFIAGLKQLFEEKKYKIALLSDLHLIMESVYGSSLDWFFLPWFDNDFLPKYNFLECNYYVSQSILKLTINDLNEPLNAYNYSQQVQLQISDSGGSIIYNEWVWINRTTTFNISLTSKPLKVRLEYGNEVIAQLPSASPTYIEAMVGEINGLIPGYNINIMLIFCLLPLIYLISKTLLGYKKKSKI